MTEKLGVGPVEATERLAAAQERLAEVLDSANGGGGVDEESRMRLRSIDVQLLKIYEDLGNTQTQDIAALRGDISELTVAIRDLIRAARPPAQRPPNNPAAPRPPGPPPRRG